MIRTIFKNVPQRWVRRISSESVLPSSSLNSNTATSMTDAGSTAMETETDSKPKAQKVTKGRRHGRYILTCLLVFVFPVLIIIIIANLL